MSHIFLFANIVDDPVSTHNRNVPLVSNLEMSSVRKRGHYHCAKTDDMEGVSTHNRNVLLVSNLEMSSG